ncbi:hypothetical protein OKW21_003781 [Catalinimonas alkaloidigena]|uniref:SiaB family protein kinase n=1 Tax=Catalinimonas alkaloidigena TaxID=1075417 RepID=UPI002406C585|nr:SiaB family protein kinase [Catalinimonas alkaloidigena]MDF9798518.1 hypothetical protein [Catalinimonas alkaloidigena]
MFLRLNTLNEQLGKVLDNRVVVYYTGPITPSIMVEIGRDIQNKLSENLRASRKVFSIFLELAQNIYFYSAEKVAYSENMDSVGTVYVIEDCNQYSVICSNPVQKIEVEELVNSYERVNSMSKDELRELRRVQRRQPSSTKSKGAGIGITQVAILSGNPIRVCAHKACADYKFFTLLVSINK